MSSPQSKYSLGIILSRTNYAESDKIVTILTKDFGKVRAIAKGSRKEKSKLAAGIELFTVSQIGFVPGRKDLATVISTRIVDHYGSFLGDLEKVNFAFECLKVVNRITDDIVDESFFILVKTLLESLNDSGVGLDLVKLWWVVRLAMLTGHNINFKISTAGGQFEEGGRYLFDRSRGGFVADNEGSLTPEHIKMVRFTATHNPKALVNIVRGTALAEDLNVLLNGFVEYHH
jgi:DNA repair protein RecO (recombination protein O)